MKMFGLAALITATLAFASHAGAPQNRSDSHSGSEIKHVSTTLPRSHQPIHMSAMSIERDWSTSVTHLKGNVLVYIRGDNNYIVIRAEEASYNPNTGELIPSGNVRITQEARITPE